MMPKDGRNIFNVIAGTAVNKVRVIIIFGVEDWVIVAFEKYTSIDTYTKINPLVDPNSRRP